MSTACFIVTYTLPYPHIGIRVAGYLDSVKDLMNARITFGRFMTLQFSEKAHNVFAPICFVWLPHETGVHIIG